MRTVLFAAVFAFAATHLSAAPRLEVGDLNGAQFRIDIPDHWNGSLVLYCHGYSPVPVQYDQKPPREQAQGFLNAGFAVAQSGYAAGGWAVSEAIVDTMSLRRYFTLKYGAPKQIYVAGQSMGGLITVLLSEQYPTEFAGAMPMCGALGSAMQLFESGFEARTVFDFYFPDVFPSPVAIPDDYKYSEDLVKEVAAKIEAKPQARDAMLRYSGLHATKELAGVITFLTFTLKEIRQRSGGNAFDNRNVIYMGSPDDNALNAGVKRYAGDARAAEYLRAHYTPTGRLARPTLAIHTTYDELIPSRVPNGYATLARLAGSGDLFVQQFVPHDGHCAISPAEIASGFAELRGWVDSGKRPEGGPVPAQ